MLLSYAAEDASFIKYKKTNSLEAAVGLKEFNYRQKRENELKNLRRSVDSCSHFIPAPSNPLKATFNIGLFNN